MKEKVVQPTFSVGAEGKHLLPFPHKIVVQKQKVPQVGNFHRQTYGSCPEWYHLGIKFLYNVQF